MKKSVLTLSLAALLALVAVTDVSAQVRVNVGPVNVGVGPGYAYGPYYYGSNYWSSPYYSYYRPYYYGPSYYYSPGYAYVNPAYPAPAYTAPYYANSTPANSAPAFANNGTQSSSSTRTSFYQDPNVANITIFVPNTDAEIWFDGTATKQRGFERQFHTPPLAPGTSYYTIRARWDDGITAVDQERKVELFPGQSLTIDFRQR